MSRNVDTIKSFLVSLGFDIDGAGQAKFEATLKGVTASVLKMGAAVEGAALAVVGFTTQITSGLDKLYWASQRTGASVNGIKALGYAAAQTGSSAEAAQNSLESLAAFMRNNPGAEGFLNRLGVQTRDASGKMRDTAAIFTGVGQKLNNMPYYRARQYAQMLGIDENTLMAMRRGLSQFSSEYALTAKKIGFNADTAAKQSNVFMTSMRNLSMTLGQARDKIGSNLAGGLAGSIDNLRKRLLDNWPKIEAVLMKVIRGILWAGDAVTRVLWRSGQAVSAVINWFKKLDPVTQQLIMLFGGLLVAWRLLNTAFLTSPVGMVIALGAAILALIEDYQTWKEGGKSLIDWGKWEPDIKSALKAMRELRDSAKAIGVEIAKLLNINLKNWTLKGDIDNLTKQFGEFGKMMSMIGELITAIQAGNWKEAYAIGKKLWSQGNSESSAAPAVIDSGNSSAEWVKDKTGFDPRSIGRTVRGWFGMDVEPEQHAQSSRDSGGTLADRNNNPGNIRPVKGGGFRFFETALHGWEAMRHQLMRYFDGKTTGKKLQTIWDIVSTWAPAGDGDNDPKKYAADVAQWMGVSPDTVLNLTDPNTMGSLMQSMARKEGYGQWNSPLAYQAAGRGANIQQETNINIYGASDPAATGREVASRQTGVNSQLTQQMSGPG